MASWRRATGPSSHPRGPGPLQRCTHDPTCSPWGYRGDGALRPQLRSKVAALKERRACRSSRPEDTVEAHPPGESSDTCGRPQGGETRFVAYRYQGDDAYMVAGRIVDRRGSKRCSSPQPEPASAADPHRLPTGSSATPPTHYSITPPRSACVGRDTSRSGSSYRVWIYELISTVRTREVRATTLRSGRVDPVRRSGKAAGGPGMGGRAAARACCPLPAREARARRE